LWKRLEEIEEIRNFEVAMNLRQVTKALWHASQKYLAKFRET
jgi:hypothetical protein